LTGISCFQPGILRQETASITVVDRVIHALMTRCESAMLAAASTYSKMQHMLGLNPLDCLAKLSARHEGGHQEGMQHWQAESVETSQLAST
jgi:hypothetical protein